MRDRTPKVHLLLADDTTGCRLRKVQHRPIRHTAVVTQVTCRACRAYYREWAKP